MQPFRGDNVSRTEWRWVTFWGGLLVVLTLIPYVWATLGNNQGWHFFGILANPIEGASALSKIRQGFDGAWLWEIRHTPEAHEPAGFFVFYMFLGHIARFFGFSAVVTFHLARIATSLLMFASLYQLGATVWKRLRPRRMFFWLAIMGSGLGWLFLLVPSDSLTADLIFPEAFPLYAAFSNPSFPLGIGLLALLTSTYLQALRPGFNEQPSMDNGGFNIIAYTFILSLVQPSALFVFGTTMTIFVLITAYRNKALPWHEIRWFSMLFLPAFPFLVYYLMVFNVNDVMRQYNEQYIADAPSVLSLIIAFGVLLFVGLPAIRHAFKHFNRDGDQLMLIWLVVNIISIYIPLTLQSRLLIGLTIPVIYFAVRGIEDYWIDRIPLERQFLALALLFVLIIPSNILVLIIPLYGVVSDSEAGAKSGIVIEEGYAEAYQWLAINGNKDEIVLASTNASIWIPAETDLRVYSAHPFETINSSDRKANVEDFFTGEDCTSVFDDAQKNKFDIDYVLWGPREDALSKDLELPQDQARSELCRVQLESDANIVLDFGEDAIKLYILREPR